MRTGLWLPVSNDLLAIAFILAFVLTIIYVLYYLAKKSANDTNSKIIEKEFLNENDHELINFGFPLDSTKVFSERLINVNKGIAILKSKSSAGFALCSHSKLKYTRLYFFVDFNHFDRISSVIFIKYKKNKNFMIKINSESSMFSFDQTRFFDVDPKNKSILMNNKLVLKIDDKEYKLKDFEINHIRQCINYIVNLKDIQSDMLKKWRNFI